MEGVVVSESDDFETVEDQTDDILDLPPPAPVLSVGDRFWNFIVDTSVIYRYGITRLASSQVAFGVAAIILGNVLFWLNKHDAWAGVGIWTGVPLFSSGLVCLAFRNKRPPKCYPNTILCMISLFASSFLLISSSVNVVMVAQGQGGKIYPRYTRDLPGAEAPLLIINSLLVVMGLVGIVLCSWIMCVCFGFVSLCCRPGRDRIYTISYDDETLDPQLTSDRDFMIEPSLRRQTPVLTIQEPDLEWDDEEYNTSTLHSI